MTSDQVQVPGNGERFVVNDRAAAYPAVLDRRYGHGSITFPQSGLSACFTCTTRSSTFKATLVSYYDSMGSWGGADVPQNGVFVRNSNPNDHPQFTTWWCNFSIHGGGNVCESGGDGS
jgi:hypothetical protein